MISSSPTNVIKDKESCSPWKNLDNLNPNPGSRAAHSCEIISNKMYLFGGWDGKKALNDLYIFDLDNYTWSEAEVNGTKPGLRNNHATATLGKYMYLHGGHNGYTWLDDLYIFDSVSMIWNQINIIGEIPSARACHTLSRVDRRLYMFGGYDGSKCYNGIEIFDTENKTWTTSKVKGKAPLSRNAHSMTVIGTNLLLFGGHSGNKHLKDLHIFETETLTWVEPVSNGESPEGLRGHTATYAGNKLIIFGGYDGKGRSNELYSLNLEDMQWTHILETEKFPGSRQRHSAVNIDNKQIIIFGGFDGTKWLNDLHILDISILIDNLLAKNCQESFQQDMQNLVNSEKFSDICFKIKHPSEKIIYGHKCIIANRSAYFSEKFENEKNLKMIEIESINLDTFICILEYIYTGNFKHMNNTTSTSTSNTIDNDKNIETLIDLLTWSNEFQIKELKTLCENKIVYGITSTNVVEVLITAYKNNFKELKALAISHVLQNFQTVSAQKNFFNLETYPQLLMEVMLASLNKVEE